VDEFAEWAVRRVAWSSAIEPAFTLSLAADERDMMSIYVACVNL
jgi:hypothetical protein